jgi:hypothetical protein
VQQAERRTEYPFFLQLVNPSHRSSISRLLTSTASNGGKNNAISGPTAGGKHAPI